MRLRRSETFLLTSTCPLEELAGVAGARAPAPALFSSSLVSSPSSGSFLQMSSQRPLSLATLACSPPHPRRKLLSPAQPNFPPPTSLLQSPQISGFSSLPLRSLFSGPGSPSPSPVRTPKPSPGTPLQSPFPARPLSRAPHPAGARHEPDSEEQPLATRHEQATEGPPRSAAAGAREQDKDQEQQPAAGDPQPRRRPALPGHAGGRRPRPPRGRGGALLRDGSAQAPTWRT